MSGRSVVAHQPGYAYEPAYDQSVAAPQLRRDLGYWAFAIQMWVLVLCQKFVLPLGPLPLSLPFITLYAWIALSIARGELRLAPMRLGLFLGLAVAALMTQVISEADISLPSLMLFLLLYLPLVFVAPVTRERYLQLLDTFQAVVVIGCAMVLLQLAWQAAFGLGNQPNLEVFVPKSLLLGGYNYAAPIAWGYTFVRPNGFFFLEPSFASSFIASALVIELMFFNRAWRVVLYGAALLGTVGATGILIMLVAAPFLIARQNLKAAVLTVFAGLLGLVAAIFTGAFDLFVGRLSELGASNSSGFQRLVKPLIQLGDVYRDPDVVLMGMGAGNSVEQGVSLWPIAKVAIEYGAIAGVLFMALIIVAMCGSRNRALAAALFVVFNFTGGFLLLPISVMQILFLVSLMPPLHGERGQRTAQPQPATRPAPRRPMRSARPRVPEGSVVPLRS